MANVSEEPLPSKRAGLIQAAGRDGLRLLKLDQTASPETVVDAIDAFVDAWQGGKRLPEEQLDPENAPYNFGSLWGDQLVRHFKWEWATITFHDHGNSTAPAVLSLDRALAVYPIHFLIGCFQNPGVDCTVALSFDMLTANKITGLQPNAYVNLMERVHRIIPRGRFTSRASGPAPRPPRG
jgi:hypothetical protein